MELDADLLEIEEQSFRRAFFSDGLLDLCVGAFLLIWAVEAYFDQAGFGGVSFALLFPAYLVLRKKITEPRVGVVKFRPQRKRRQKAMGMLALGVLAFTIMLAVVLYITIHNNDEPPSESTRRFAPLPLGVVFALMLTIVGFKYEIQRAFSYAMWIVVCFVITVFFNEQLPFDDLALALGLSCIVPLANGQVMLLKFLRRYPRA